MMAISVAAQLNKAVRRSEVKHERKMKAALKVETAPRATIALIDIPQISPRDVLVEVKAASI